MEATPYIGRFAPSPTGPLHAGSLAAALASWLDAKAHGGQWLVRIEDTDTPRCVPGADMVILQQLAACGLHPDAPPVYQSQRSAVYQGALDQLIAQVQAYPCGCSRQDIERANERATQQASERASVQASERANERATQPVIALAVQQAIALAVQQAMAPAIESADAQANAVSGSPDHCRPRHNELVYPGTCRDGLYGKTARSWRFLTRFNLLNKPVAQQIRARAAPDLGASTICRWTDRWLGAQQQNVSAEVGDFVLKRADGLWAYQLAVVVDDAAQGVTHVVRGADLADNTARQILLQRALGLRQPQYLHTPLVLGANGEKLSKQNGAPALDTTMPVVALQAAALTLGLHLQADSVPECLDTALQAWLAA